MGKWLATVVGAVIAGVLVWYITVGQPRKTPVVSVSSTQAGLSVRNNTDQAIRIRVAYLVRDSGGATYCYPQPTRADGVEDPLLLPKQEKVVPPGKCGADFNGYNVKVWDGSYSRLLHEIGG